MKISVQSEDFNIGDEISALTNGRTDMGAVASFTGFVRDFHKGKKIYKMTLEHFPGMAQKQLTDIAAQAEKRWPLQDICIIHRYGPLLPGEQIVLVLTTSAHREAAFEAAAFIMDWLKTDAPFWKKEQTESGEAWVEAKAEDDAKKDRWKR